MAGLHDALSCLSYCGQGLSTAPIFHAASSRARLALAVTYGETGRARTHADKDLVEPLVPVERDGAAGHGHAPHERVRLRVEEDERAAAAAAVRARAGQDQALVRAEHGLRARPALLQGAPCAARIIGWRWLRLCCQLGRRPMLLGRCQQGRKCLEGPGMPGAPSRALECGFAPYDCSILVNTRL